MARTHGGGVAARRIEIPRASSTQSSIFPDHAIHDSIEIGKTGDVLCGRPRTDDHDALAAGAINQGTSPPIAAALPGHPLRLRSIPPTACADVLMRIASTAMPSSSFSSLLR